LVPFQEADQERHREEYQHHLEGKHQLSPGRRRGTTGFTL
jgi:hypothetical protein